ncbi:diguanylate cyclase (GGDEF) domain-containing protein [Allopseudospirillum japonicum]|uniref:Diguanylate cyclase (GGDEF) domain-containing protein n=1 Tax=Allopseudospirillum japonicum TaxID=64971 RepID=A0A1H6Q0K1_9GAMM|nr:EAL domain-containing protein [Allopseudospirillum japonicum]SEI37389.1 diguanylate cyclase (GGDEF) domain-containing protein [Allopseudospirillum japonicum]
MLNQSLKSFLLSRTLFFSFLGFIAILWAAERAYQTSVLHSAKINSDIIAKSTFNAMYQVMSQGWTRQQLEDFIHGIEKDSSGETLNINIFRGHLVSELFGTLNQPAFDAQHLNTFNQKIPQFTNEDFVSRYTYPLIASEACLQCHTNATLNDILGLVEVKMNNQNQLKSAYGYLVEWLIIISPLPIILALFAIRQILKKVNASINVLTKGIQSIEKLDDIQDLYQNHTKKSLGFSELTQIFTQVQSLGKKLNSIAVDKNLLEFEIKLLEKFVITSDVVRDWREYVNTLMRDINQVINVYTMFTLFKIDDEQFSLDVFWLNIPDKKTRLAMEEVIKAKLKEDSLFQVINIEIHHNIADRQPLKVILERDQLELQCKSLLMDTPKIGGIVGIGVHADIVKDQTKVLVLESTLSTLLNVVGSIKAIYKYTKDLEYYATRDPLTDLYNQRIFWELLNYDLDRAQRHQYPTSLILIDLDNFKTINDSFGHSVGDEVLKLFSSKVQSNIRPGDLAARYGGDEFVLVLPETELADASTLAHNLQDVIHSINFKINETNEIIKINASIGVGSYPEHAQSSRDLFMFVDNLMYKAKACGKNQVCIPTDEDLLDLFKDINDKTMLVTKAIEQRTLVPVYQPIVDLNTGTLVAVEVLSRIQLPDDQLLSAKEFIEIAENIGKIHMLDYIIMDKAFSAAHNEKFQGLIFINLSPKAIMGGDFLRYVQELTQRYKVPAEQIVFEITERDTVKSLDMMEKLMSNLKELGFQMAIDDFGSGFSSFQYLKRFPIDFVKIEGEFIANMVQDPLDEAFVNTIVALAKSIGALTVGEFIESAQVRDKANQCHVNLGQGYYISRPQTSLAAAQKAAQDYLFKSS